MPTELISKKTCNEFAEHFVSWTLRTIQYEFDAADIACDDTFQPPVSGQRRTLVHQYYRTLNLANPADVQKLLRVFEGVLNAAQERLTFIQPGEHEAKYLNTTLLKLGNCLRRDGYQFKDGRLSPLSPTASLHVLKQTAIVFNADYLTDQVRRLEQAVEVDTAQAIGASKELVETCCYTILSERGKPAIDKPDLLPLVRRTLEELKLVPEGIPEEARGAKSIKALLGNLATMCQNLAELRNLYGTGHGKDGKSKGLTSRHARLCVGMATTLSVFLFDTHKARS